MRDRVSPGPLFTADRGWLGLALAMLAVALDQQASYWLVPYACNHGPHWPLYVVTTAALAIDLAGGVVAVGRIRHFAGMVGTGAALLFGLAILSDLAAKLILDPCQK